MTQEEKQLLLKDLCARLPYGVILNVTLKNKYDKIVNRDIELTDNNLTYITSDSHWIMYKPYLRPMSSMTEEEYESVSWEGCSHAYNYSSISGFRFVEIKTYTLNILNWLNANHFDYRNLIPRGLALKAPKGMYKMEE